MTPFDRTSHEAEVSTPKVSKIAVVTTLVCAVAAVVLGLTGHDAVAVAVSGAAGTSFIGGVGIHVTIRIRG